MPDLSPLRLDNLAADLEEAAAVAEVHSGVRLALAAGRTLHAGVQRLTTELARVTGERDDVVQVLADLHHPAYQLTDQGHAAANGS